MPGTVGNAEVMEQAQAVPVEIAPATGTSSTLELAADEGVYFDDDEPRMRRDADRYSINRVTRELRRRKANLERELAKTNAGLALLEADPRSIDVYRTLMEAY